MIFTHHIISVLSISLPSDRLCCWTVQSSRFKLENGLTFWPGPGLNIEIGCPTSNPGVENVTMTLRDDLMWSIERQPGGNLKWYTPEILLADKGRSVDRSRDWLSWAPSVYVWWIFFPLVCARAPLYSTGCTFPRKKKFDEHEIEGGQLFVITQKEQYYQCCSGRALRFTIARWTFFYIHTQ